MSEEFEKVKKFLIFAVILIILVAVFFLIGPEEIVEKIGIEGGYALIFVTALIGVSSFTSASFYATLVAFASTGEFNPFIIALVAAPAAAFGDSLFFFFGYHGRKLFNGPYIESFSNWIRTAPKWTVPLVAYLYTGFSPLPQDFLMISLGLGGAKFKWVLLAVLLGNATFITILSYLVMMGFM